MHIKKSAISCRKPWKLDEPKFSRWGSSTLVSGSHLHFLTQVTAKPAQQGVGTSSLCFEFPLTLDGGSCIPCIFLTSLNSEVNDRITLLQSCGTSSFFPQLSSGPLEAKSKERSRSLSFLLLCIAAESFLISHQPPKGKKCLKPYWLEWMGWGSVWRERNWVAVVPFCCC